jgi:hypothetical protein
MLFPRCGRTDVQKVSLLQCILCVHVSHCFLSSHKCFEHAEMHPFMFAAKLSSFV